MISKLWSKITFVVLDVALLVYLVLAMTAFNKPLIETNSTCSEVKINIQENVTDGFLSIDDIKNILVTNKIYPSGKDIDDVSTREIEETLMQNNLIESALCYTTTTNKIIIDIKQKMAVMRIKSINGEDYYLDCNGNLIKDVIYPTDMIIATGYISQKYAKKYLSEIGNFLVQDNFWKDEIEQINIQKDGTIEMVPRTGSHIIYLGDPINIDEKMARLYKFYKYGLNEIGWNKYSYINLEFGNQIICKKKQ